MNFTELHRCHSVWRDGYREGMLDARIAAFGAIRRAAMLARDYDAVANSCYNYLYPPVREQARENAKAVREAIRAAIGSDKA